MKHLPDRQHGLPT